VSNETNGKSSRVLSLRDKITIADWVKANLKECEEGTIAQAIRACHADTGVLASKHVFKSTLEAAEIDVRFLIKRPRVRRGTGPLKSDRLMRLIMVVQHMEKKLNEAGVELDPAFSEELVALRHRHSPSHPQFNV
jgi:hypothetical protein